MITADHDRRLDASFADELVQSQSEARALAVPEPQDARGQPLERDALAREPNPARERIVVSKHFHGGVVAHADVLGVARQRCPSEWTSPFAKQRPYVLRHEAADVERIRDAGLRSLRPNVIAVVERHG